MTECRNVVKANPHAKTAIVGKRIACRENAKGLDGDFRLILRGFRAFARRLIRTRHPASTAPDLDSDQQQQQQ
jgi:hypothetical protein